MDDLSGISLNEHNYLDIFDNAEKYLASHYILPIR